MSELKVTRKGQTESIFFSGSRPLRELLAEAGIQAAHPCGGRGVCGKCAVTAGGELSPLTEAERRAGTRLSCQITVLGDAEVLLPQEEDGLQIETGGSFFGPLTLRPMEGRYGAAVDIGTTTLAARGYDLKTGECIASASCVNPQVSVAADVMGRIGAAMNGGLEGLRQQVLEAVCGLLAEMGDRQPETLVVTGNTTMLTLLTGRDPEPLSHAPFQAASLFGTEESILEKQAYLPPCMNAFVGADITCAVLAAGMCRREETALLCDIGTNGELALWHENTLYVTSTAAGPAFEGAGISCGCGSVRGAVDRVTAEGNRLSVHTIGDAPAVGVCGSGLIDAVAAGLETGRISETGLLEEGELRLFDSVALTQQDIRAVQLAKAAIAAGIATLLDTAGVPEEAVKTLHIAGGFGSHLDLGSAVRIGLLPQGPAERGVVLGNAALSGAAMALLDREQKAELERIAGCSVHVSLGGNPGFNERYMDEMLFPEEE